MLSHNLTKTECTMYVTTQQSGNTCEELGMGVMHGSRWMQTLQVSDTFELSCFTNVTISTVHAFATGRLLSVQRVKLLFNASDVLIFFFKQDVGPQILCTQATGVNIINNIMAVQNLSWTIQHNLFRTHNTFHQRTCKKKTHVLNNDLAVGTIHESNWKKFNHFLNHGTRSPSTMDAKTNINFISRCVSIVIDDRYFLSNG